MSANEAPEATPFAQELRERIARIRGHSRACPDLTGFELAYERGNISDEEWNAVQQRAAGYQQLIDQEVAQIEALAARCPAEFERYLEKCCAQLRRILDRLNQQVTADEPFQHRFTRALLPDLIAGFEERLGQRPTRHAFSWLLWVSADVLRDFPEPPSSAEG